MKTRYDISRRSGPGRYFGTLCIVVFLVLPHNVWAQQASALEGFLGDGAPAILFEVNSLSLDDYSGGLGIWYSVSENFHWTFVLSPSLNGTNNEHRELGDLSTRKFSSYSLGLTAAPFWILDSDGDLCLTAGPLLSYAIGLWKYEEAFTSPEELYESETTEHSLTIGAQAGAGYALTPSLLLHLQYRLYGLGSWSSADGATSQPVRWHFDAMGLLSLGVRL